MTDYVCCVDNAALKYAEDTFGETTQTRSECVATIRQWLRTTAKTLIAHQDTRTILTFLRGCKFNIEKTKEKMNNYYRMRFDRPEWFEKRDPTRPELVELLDNNAFLPLAKRDSLGRMVIIIRAGAHDPAKHDIENVFKLSKIFECSNSKKISNNGLKVQSQ